MNENIAIFAAGCFWGVQAYFDRVEGVTKTTVGYIGGQVANPTYKQVCTHTTGHAEAVKIEFNPSVISFHKLLRHFFAMHDPTQLNRQGPDVGDNYRSAIFYLSDEQKKAAHDLIIRLNAEHAYKKPIVTQLEKASTFYEAEDYHQKYFDKTGIGACAVWPDQVDIDHHYQ